MVGCETLDFQDIRDGVTEAFGKDCRLGLYILPHFA